MSASILLSHRECAQRMDTRCNRLAKNSYSIQGNGSTSIALDGDMEVFMHQEVVIRSLPNDFEIVHIRFLKAYHASETIASLTCSLIFDSGREAGARDALRIVKCRNVDSAVRVKCYSENLVEVPCEFYEFPRSAIGARDKDQYVNWEGLAHREGASSCR